MILSVASLCIATTFANADEFAGQFFIESAAQRAPTTAAQKIKSAPVAPAASRDVDPRFKAAAGGTTLASWYGGGEKLARHTATGEVFRPEGLTAAHRTLPLGTRLVVSAQGRSIIVRVNDRGPAKWTGRSLDLSKGAARALGIIGRGTARVTYRVAGL